MRKTLTDCQQEATVLAGLLEGLDLMSGNSDLYTDARASLTIAARKRARQLAADLERLESGLKKRPRRDSDATMATGGW